jgi:WD40 repeat protein
MAALGTQSPSALVVFGLQSVKAIDRVLASTNQLRDEFRKNLSIPLVLWVTDEVLQKLTRFAPDFKSWAATSIKFELDTEQLLNLWNKTADDIFSRLRTSDLEQFVTNKTLGLAPGCRRRQELESAIRDLSSRDVDLAPSHRAIWTLILGRDAFVSDQLEAALEQYQHSLNSWQQAAKSPTSKPQSLEPVGIVLYHISLCYCRQAQLQPLASRTKWQQAKDSLSATIEVFRVTGHSALVAQLSLQLGEVLRQLESWTELEALALRSLEDSQLQNSPLRLAQAYGFLAAVALAQSNWEDAKCLALASLDLIKNLGSSQWLHQRWYLLLAAKAQRQLGEPLCAIAHLEKALQTETSRTKSQKKQPQIEIYILEELRSLHSEQKQYLRAFELKQQQRSLEQQYGFSTFLGAAPLQPFSRQGRGISSLEIAAAGRQLDVNRLIERLGRNDHKLTIIHGSSGVGKSSLLNAGLVPALESRIIGYRVAVPILQKTYRNWITQLERRLEDALMCRQVEPASDAPEPLTCRWEPTTETSISQEPTTSWEQRMHSDSQTVTSQQAPAGTIPETSALHSWKSAERHCIPEMTAASQTPDAAHLAQSSLAIALAIAKSQALSPSPIPSFQPLISNPKLQKILKQLRLAGERKLLTILIFDQFEEFFFACSNLEQRREFYEFLAQCLNLPYLKVILSLREDYLHYLLECERYCNLNTINNNILDRQLRYHLGDLTPDDARKVICTLAAVSQFHLENALIAALVRDLSGSTGAVRLIEMQVVGQQLQTEKITTLEQYYALGTDPKTTLVQRSLLSVIGDCGQENEELAWQILFSLTDERGTRPAKTESELLIGTYYEPKCFSEGCGRTCDFPQPSMSHELDLILKILVGSGLVFRIPEEQQNRYQLVHDYLVEPIRQQYQQRTQFHVLAQLEQSEQTLRRVRKHRLRAVTAGVVMAVLAVTAGGLGWRAEVQRQRAADLSINAQLNALSASSEALFVSNKKFDALLEGLRAARHLKQLEANAIPVEPDTRLQVVTALSQAMYKISERNRLEGHGDVVSSVSFSPDGQLIASASKDNTVKLWHPDGRLIATLKGHTESVTSVSFSGDSQLLASGSWDGTVKLWRRDGTLLRTFKGHGGKVYGLSFSPKAQLIASASADGKIRLWTASGQLIRAFQSHKEVVSAISFSPDGQTLASTSRDSEALLLTADHTIKLWTLEGTLKHQLRGHGSKVNSVAFSPDGQVLASASDDRTIKLWSRTGQLLKTFPQQRGWVKAVTFSADGQWLASASSDSTVQLWKRDGTLVRTFTGHGDSVNAVSFSPSFNRADATDKGQGKGTIPTSSRASPLPMLASASHDKTIKLWGLDHPTRPILQHQTYLREVVFSPDNQRIATAGDDATVKIWNRRGRLLHTLKGHTQRIDSISFSPDGQWIASASRDGTVRLWTTNGMFIKSLTGHRDAVLSVCFSPDGKRLASASQDGTVKLWTSNGTLIKTLTPDPQVLPPATDQASSHLNEKPNQTVRVNAVTFSPDGQLLASASDDQLVRLWSVDGRLLKTLQGHTNWVLDVSFSSDSQILASASYDNTVKLWSRKGDLIRTLRGHTDSVARIRFSPTGKILATTSWDNRIQFWRLDDTLIKTLEEHQDRVTSLSWSDNGQALASASRDQRVILWNLDLDDLLDKSCNWLSYYLQNNPKVRQNDHQLCQASLNDKN